MASLSSSFFSFFFFLIPFALIGQCSQEQFKTFHTINIQSLLPRNVCSSSEDLRSLGPATLKVVHRYGPCSPLHGEQNVDHKQILEADQSRVNAIHRLVSTNSQQAKPRDPLDTSAIPANIGDSLGTGNYIVTIGFGSPKQNQTMMFDTGSDITWIQCKPCISCYQQEEPIFDPSQSSTYTNISCSSPYCSKLSNSSCTSPTCDYEIGYGDGSYTSGTLAEDTLTLTSSSVLPQFKFGCGQYQGGSFGKVAGLLGLGRRNVSLVLQSLQTYGGVFSYCLPSTSSSIGYLTFGEGYPSYLPTIPIETNPNFPTFYFVDLVSIYVDGGQLQIDSTVFSNPGIIIDSGTVISRLPPAAYNALRASVREVMWSYKSAPAAPLLDTCYDFSGVDYVDPVIVTFEFANGVSFNLDPSGVFYALSDTKTCLAFTGNSDPSTMGIIGNVQQRKFNVVYDISKMVIGFGANEC